MAGAAISSGTQGERHIEAVRGLAALMLADTHGLSVGMTDRLHQVIPELAGADEDMLEETRASCEGNIAQVLRLLRRGDPAASLVMPPEASEYARGLVRRGIPLPVLLRSYRLGHAWLWDTWSAAMHEHVTDPDILVDALDASSAFLFEYVDVIAGPLVEAYGSERERMHRSAAALRAETVQQILAGEPVDEEVASRRLGYELRRWHVGVKVTAHNGHAGDLHGLERAASEAGAALGCSQPLVVPSGAAVLCVWCGSHGQFPDDVLAAVEAYEPPEGIRVAVGRPAQGVEGFRQTQEEAIQAARVGGLSAGGSPVASYRDVELVSLLVNDFNRAQRFVAAQLGQLALDDDSTARLRETVLAFLDANGSNVRVARSLHVHQNTVIYRINRAEELLGHPVTQRQTELSCALRLALALGDSVLLAKG